MVDVYYYYFYIFKNRWFFCAKKKKESFAKYLFLSTVVEFDGWLFYFCCYVDLCCAPQLKATYDFQYNRRNVYVFRTNRNSSHKSVTKNNR